MLNHILQTKLYLPPIRPDWVARQHLLDRLTLQPHTRLVLVSAPAGYGKTTLITVWLRQLEAANAAHVCWLALDEDDSAPRQFFGYLAAAVQALPGGRTSLARLLQAEQEMPAKTWLNAFVQDVTPVSAPFILVLDDYHTLDSAEIDQALALLLDRMPPHMTLTLTSRSDPGFPVSRLRARGQLIELRAADLRFTETEAAQFLQQTMGLTLSEAQIAALEHRTEGWIAGLQMAALSLQNRSRGELDSFIRNFTGSHRFILDYLLEEALHQQPEVVRDFLLATSILEQLSGPLCDTLTGRSDGQLLLEQLERNNLFVISLDDERRWYRYHHLFADVLHAHAQRHCPQHVTEWHRRAGRWFAQNGAMPPAIRHALAAEDFAQAAHLLELLRWQIDGIYPIKQWLAWADALPAEQIAERPVLTLVYGWALLENGNLAEAEVYLQATQSWLNKPQAKKIIADEETWRVLPASLSAAHAYLALSQGDVAGTIAHAQAVLDFFQDEDHYWRGVGLSLLGLTRWMQGDLPAAARTFAELTGAMRRTGKLVDAISTAYTLAEMLLALGNLSQAEAEIAKILPLAEPPHAPPLLGTSDLYRFLSVLAWERGDSETAEKHLRRAVSLGEDAALTNWGYRLCLVQSYFKRSQGDFAGALAALDEAERVYTENPIPLLRPVSALKAQIWLAQGELAQAESWAQTQNLGPKDTLHYLREFEYLTLARLLLARYQAQKAAKSDRLDPDQNLNDALTLLRRLLTEAEAGQRLGSVLEILILQALALAAQNDIDAALVPLARALALATPQGYVRRFTNEGPPMARLLTEADKRGLVTHYTRKLLAAFPRASLLSANSSKIRNQNSDLIEPLSDRELEILHLVAAGLKNKEIAEQLVISLNTVLYHTKNIYGKLGVNKRTLAVAKARELGLL